MDEKEEPSKKKIKLSDEKQCSQPTSLDQIERIDNEIDQCVQKDDAKEQNSSCSSAEYSVGIKYFLNQSKKFSGIIKQRHSDFLVRECDLQGNPVYLTSLNHIEEDVEEPVKIKCPIADSDIISNIETFAASTDRTLKLTLKIDNDKDHRKDVHKYIKDTYKQIETDTITSENGDRAIQLRFKTKQSARRDKQRSNPNKQFLHFVLFKQGQDTMSCVNLLSSKIHKNTTLFSYAGTKDKRACTIQRLAVKDASSKQIAGLNSSLNQRNIAVGNFSYKKECLRLGDLCGNEFVIVIRNVGVEDDVIKAGCEALASSGFINYFGLQRFGTGATPTYEVGKAMLKGNFDDVVDLILKPREGGYVTDPEYHAKKTWIETKDAEAALRKLRYKSSLEGKLISNLCNLVSTDRNNKKKYNTQNAFFRLPRNMRLFYLHSYQSLVWNNVVSKRIKDYGMKLCVGDLVLTKDKDTKGFDQVYVLTDADIISKSYSIYDVVLPLPGFDMTYPANLLQFYKDFFTNDGLSIDELKNKNSDLSLSGVYRKMVILPKNVSWETFIYDDYCIPVVENDLEKLLKLSKSSENIDVELGVDVQNEKTVKIETNGEFKGVKLTLTLPSSCYATTALREILIDDSSYQSQTKLNNDQSKLDKEESVNNQ